MEEQNPFNRNMTNLFVRGKYYGKLPWKNWKYLEGGYLLLSGNW